MITEQRFQLRDPTNAYQLKWFPNPDDPEPVPRMSPPMTYTQAVALKAMLPQLEIVYFSRHDE